jgi:hypothetical protein
VSLLGDAEPSVIIEKEEREPMFKDTKAFSGFAVNDAQKAKEFYG